MAKRLLEKHPTYKKVKLLEAFLEAHNLSIEWDGYNMILKDRDNFPPDIKIVDMDDGSAVSTFPPYTEYKLILIE